MSTINNKHFANNWDWENALSLAEERAAERERVKVAELLDQERAKAHEEKVEIARELQKKGLSLDFIANTTKLPLAIIETL